MTATLIKASAHDTGLESGSVHTVVTSPPYKGLRDYDGDQAIEWPAVEYASMPGLPTITIPPMTCGLGEETTPESYIGHMVLVMREMWRVLRDDGTAWINLGDSFAGSGGAGGDYNDGGIRDGQPKFKSPKSALKAKTKMLIPHRFALAMQAEGWIVRNDIVWAKGLSGMKTALQSAYDELVGGDAEMPDYAGSCMPYSGQDNVTPSHEYIFLMSKGPRYYYDNVAVAEGSIDPEYRAAGRIRKTVEPMWIGSKKGNNRGGLHKMSASTSRNLRSVLVINPGSYNKAHFATFPPRLPELCILAGTSAKGVCPECGAQWARVVERTAATPGQQPGYTAGTQTRNDGDRAGSWTDHRATTTGWQPTCTCDAGEPVPATVLDPFSGSGTTGMMAVTHNRAYIGIDLSDEYFKLTNDRLSGTQPMLPGILA